ncbi:MAG: DUF3006 domain-containing protein [Bacillota bacterium]|nr:DUF3006 domain-containing protein [Bacillota bacterium]
MRVTIDRFENNFAVCEKDDRAMINIERNKIPLEAKEGDILDIEGNFVSINKIETEKRKKQIDEMTKDLWE